MGPSLPPLRTDHLTNTLSGPYGLCEHVLLDRPRTELCYTTDDNARALVVLSRCFPEDAAMWVLGRNDAHVLIYDSATGVGFDGLEPASANQSRGVESTLAALGALDALRRYEGSTVA
jgi:hypothetical protein